LNPCATRNYKTLKLKTSKIGLRLICASRIGVIVRTRAAIDLTVIDPVLLRAVAGAFDPLLGRSSAGALDRRSPALDRTYRLQLLLEPLLAFPNSCPLSPKLPECFLFFQKAYKTEKTQKESKIDKIT
jgi:hypothetical protein